MVSSPASGRSRLSMLCLGALGGVGLVVAIAATLCVAAVATSGALAQRPGDWTVPVTPVQGWTVQANVAGLARLATSPLGSRLLDGRAFTTPAGRLVFSRDGRALLVRCAPCRIEHPRFASSAISLPDAEMRLTPRRGSGGNTLDGIAMHGAVRVDLVAQLRADGIEIAWTLPETPAAELVRIFGDAVPEARHARLAGSVSAQGRLHLPSGRRSLRLVPRGLFVDGLATELMQHGTVPYACAAASGRLREAATGDDDRGWRTLETLGMLPAAVVAATDPQFRQAPSAWSEESSDVASGPTATGAGSDHAARGFAALLFPPAAQSGTDEAGNLHGPGVPMTLTQRLALSLYVTRGAREGQPPPFAERVRIALYALEMERTLSRDRVLTLYLNTAAWGPGICGARAAARTYFRKTPRQLSPLESAWLASILEAPDSAYRQQFAARQPDPTQAVQVLARMHELPRSERQRWSSRPIVFATPPAGSSVRLADTR
jgi:penicillin-binding protein 1A